MLRVIPDEKRPKRGVQVRETSSERPRRAFRDGEALVPLRFRAKRAQLERLQGISPERSRRGRSSAKEKLRQWRAPSTAGGRPLPVLTFRIQID